MQGNRPTAASDSYLAELGWTRSGRRNGWAHHNAAIRCLRCQLQGYPCTHSKIQIVSERAGGGLRMGRCEECRDEDRSKGPCEAAGRLDATRWVYQRKETATKPHWIKTIRDPKGGRRQLKGDREEMTSARVEEDSPEVGGGTATSLAEIGLDLGGLELPRELEVESSSHQGVDDVELPRETAVEAVDTQEPDFDDLGHEAFDHHEDDLDSVSSYEPHPYGHDEVEKDELMRLSISFSDQCNEPNDYHELSPSVRTPVAVATRRDPLSDLDEPIGRQQHPHPRQSSANPVMGQALSDPSDRLDLGDHLARDTYPASPTLSNDILQSAQGFNIGQDPSLASRSRSSTTRLRTANIALPSEALSASPEVHTANDGIDIIESTLLATNIHGPVANHIVDVVDEAGTLTTSSSTVISDIAITREAGHSPFTTPEGIVPAFIVKEVTDADHTTISSTLFHPGSITEGWTGWELLAAFRDHYPLHKLKPETWHIHNQVERIIERGHRPVDVLDPALHEFVLHNARPQHLTLWGRSRLRAMINLLTPESSL